jgi:hypothetical protein
MENILKDGDKVKITTDLNELNRFMYQYAGKEATVIAVQNGNSYGQIALLDIDDGEWYWSFYDKLDQIFKIKND